MAAGIYSMEFFVKQITLSLRQAIGGYWFSPSEEELINYLKSKNPGYREDLCIIPTLGNIYAINPWDLPEKFSEKSIIPSNGREWWFICPQMQNRRLPRKTPCGYSWKITGKSTDIKIDGQKIGSKTIFVFPGIRRPKGSKNYKTLWLIHEYRLPEKDMGKLDTNYVLCHLKPKQDEMCPLQTDDAGSIPEHLIQKTMESLRKSAQHHNLPQFSLPDHLQLFQRGLQSQNNSFHSNINQVTNIGSSPANDFSLDNGHTDKSIEFESSRGTTKEDRRVESLFTEDLFYARVQKGAEPRLEKVQQETAARNIGPCISSYEAEARAKLPQHGLQSPNNSSSLRTTKEDECVDAMPDADLSRAKVQRGEEPRLEMVQQETGARNIEDEAAAGAKLLPHGLQSPNNSSSSTTHLFMNVGNSSDADLSRAKVQRGEEPRLEMVQQETGARKLGTTNEDEWVDTMPDADLSRAKVQRGEEPRLEMVQQETRARNIEDEAAVGAKLLPHGLQSSNNSSSSTTHHFTNVGNSSDAYLSRAKVQRGEEPRLEMVQQEAGGRNIEDEAAAGAKLLQRELESRSIRQSTNIGSSYVPNADLSYAEVQNGEEPDKSIQLESSFGRAKDEEWADSLIVDYVSDTEVQKGEEPCLEKVQQELEHEEHNLAGNPPKRRRLDVSEVNQIQ